MFVLKIAMPESEWSELQRKTQPFKTVIETYLPNNVSTILFTDENTSLLTVTTLNKCSAVAEMIAHLSYCWPQYTNVTDRTDRQDRQDNGSIPTVLQTVAQKHTEWPTIDASVNQEKDGRNTQTINVQSLMTSVGESQGLILPHSDTCRSRSQG